MEEDTRKAVAAILADVRAEGLPAVLAWTRKLDGVSLDPPALQIPGSALAAARADLDQRQPDLMAALREMIRNVRRFAEGQRGCLRDLELPLPLGGTVGEPGSTSPAAGPSTPPPWP